MFPIQCLLSQPTLTSDADHLVMLVNQASGTHGGVYMGRGLASCVNVLGILVMLVNQASGTHGGVYMGRGLASCVNVLGILVMLVNQASGIHGGVYMG